MTSYSVFVPGCVWRSCVGRQRELVLIQMFIEHLSFAIDWGYYIIILKVYNNTVRWVLLPFRDEGCRCKRS